MAERSRIRLPSLGALVPVGGPPTIDEARAALGGTATGTRPGTFVRVERGRQPADGVVGDRAEPIGPTEALEAVRADLFRFGALRVGGAVRAQRPRAPVHGILREACRYGGLVEVDGRILAVSFRLLGPA
jgi:hypothetical protein